MTSPIFVDAYAEDFNEQQPNIGALVAAGLPWAGMGVKATEGTYYPANRPRDLAWFQAVWPAIKTAANARYGVDFFRWTYHYFRVDEDPIQQAELCLGLVDSAGGWADGDLPLIVDVETSEQPRGTTAHQVIDGVSTFAARVAALNGRVPILYAGSYIRDLGITDHMGCQRLITAAYGSTLPAHLYLDMGWSLDDLLGWQYQGTEAFTGPKGYPQKCPLTSPGQPLDLTAITIANGSTPEEQLAILRSICQPS